MQHLLTWIETTGLDRLIWTTDVDETLLEKSANPNDVTQVPGLEDDCEALDKSVGGGFYVITGRDLPWLDRVFPRGTLRASCEYHCLFRRYGQRAPEELNPKPHWHLIDSDMNSLLDQYDGLLLRKKPFMRSLHYSGVAPDEKDTVKRKLEKRLKSLLEFHNRETGQAVTITDGGKVFDMGPSDSDKGDALRDILDHARSQAGRSFIPLYFGDSPGDLPAATVAKQAGGKFIAVGHNERVTAVADFTLRDPAACRMVVKNLIRQDIRE